MNRIQSALLGCVTATMVCLAAPAAAQEGSDVTVFDAAKIITMEPSQPSARVVAVSGGIILGTGDTVADLAAWTAGRKVTYDHRFATNVLMPGLIDPHVHPILAAVSLNLPYIAPDDWNLPSGYSPGVRTPEGYRARLIAALGKSSATPFITWGYHELFHGSLDRAELDRIAPDRPVIIWQRSFHIVIMNTKALARYGFDTQEKIDAAVKALPGSDASHINLARGSFEETGLQVAMRRMQADIVTPAKMRTGLAEMQKMMLNSGVTTISDMGTGIFAPFDGRSGCS